MSEPRFAVVFSEGFNKSVRLLPAPVRKKLPDLLVLVSDNPYDSRLHTKSLNGKLSEMYSFRITRDYRVAFIFKDHRTIQLIRAKHRKDIYR
mgnify:CR=1 FL=1